MGGEKLKPVRLAFFACLLFAFLCFFGAVIPLSAQTTATDEQAQPLPPLDESTIILGEAIPAAEQDELSSVFLVVRMVLVLAVAALAIYGVVFFIKRISRPQEIRDPNLKILARVPLGNDAFAAVLSVGAKAWLVGGGSGGVNLLADIDDIEAIETMLLEDARRSEEAGIRRYFNFASLLKRRPDAKEELPGIFHAEDLRKQRERLRGL